MDDILFRVLLTCCQLFEIYLKNHSNFLSYAVICIAPICLMFSHTWIQYTHIVFERCDAIKKIKYSTVNIETVYQHVGSTTICRTLASLATVRLVIFYVCLGVGTIRATLNQVVKSNKRFQFAYSTGDGIGGSLHRFAALVGCVVQWNDVRKLKYGYVYQRKFTNLYCLNYIPNG